jgi:hypothetical protein
MWLEKPGNQFPLGITAYAYSFVQLPAEFTEYILKDNFPFWEVLFFNGVWPIIL